MRPLTPAELLAVWEQGQGMPAHRRAVLLLGAACPDETPEEIMGLCIGNRDWRLLTLREWTFGPELVSLTQCPACGEQLEFRLDVETVRSAPVESDERWRHLELDEFSLDFRLPNTDDLMAAGNAPDAGEGRQALIERCVVNARRKDQELSSRQLPPKVVEALGTHMASADPQADTRLELECMACGRRWQALFDIVSYFWSEIHVWAVRTLREIHLLASAYGWSEAQILNMSAVRRNLYLDMVGA